MSKYEIDQSDSVTDLFSDRFDCDPFIPDDVIMKIRSVETFDESSLDRIYPLRYRLLSEVQWTQVRVARVIAAMLKEYRETHRKILDVGSGVGRLCFALYYLTDLEIYGIEQRRHLHRVARAIAIRNRMKRVHLSCVNMTAMDWAEFDIIYLYNPFQEHLCETGLVKIDDKIPFDSCLYAEYTSEVFRRLCWARNGQILVTFHGYGGNVPSSWRLLKGRHIDGGQVCLWRKEEHEKT